jgi:hypothetical protein
LVQCSCHIARDFNQLEPRPVVRFQHRLTPESEVLAQSRKELNSANEMNVIRYFVDGGLRVLRPTAREVPTADVREEDILAEIVVKLAVDYVCPKELFGDQLAIGAFSKNAVFHAWPYWRSLIHLFSDQLRLPRITLPMLRQHSLASTEPPTTSAEGPKLRKKVSKVVRSRGSGRRVSRKS